MEEKNSSQEYDFENSVIKIKNAYSDKISQSIQKTPLLMTIEYYDFDKDFLLFSWIGLNHFSTKQYRISDPNSHRKNLHYHDNFEIIFVIRGTTRVLFENSSVHIHQGECMIINRNIAHLEKPDDSCDFVLLSLSNHFITTIIENDYIISDNDKINKRMPQIYRMLMDELDGVRTNIQYWLFTPTVDSSEIKSKAELKFAEMISTMNQKKDGFYFHMQELLVQFFCVIIRPSMYQMQQYISSPKKSEEIFKQITKILEERDGLISREELSKKMNYDDHHLNRIVKNKLGISLVDYARTFTTKKATLLLTTTDLPIEEIIHQLGFSNKTYFFNIFKTIYGITPKQYRETFSPTKKNDADEAKK